MLHSCWSFDLFVWVLELNSNRFDWVSLNRKRNRRSNRKETQPKPKTPSRPDLRQPSPHPLSPAAHARGPNSFLSPGSLRPMPCAQPSPPRGLAFPRVSPAPSRPTRPLAPLPHSPGPHASACSRPRRVVPPPLAAVLVFCTSLPLYQTFLSLL